MSGGVEVATGVWADVVGQPAAVAELRVAVEDTGAMTHAWLFTGPPGSGRSVAARAFAAALQCAERGCGQCQACHTVLTGTHADVDVVVPDGLSIGVAAARAIVARAVLTPAGRRWNVVIVEDADRLTESAANALLKLLEEPPVHSVLLLCAPSVEDVLPTVRSRCRLVSLRVPATEAVADVLVRRDGVDPATARFAAAAAQGHVGRARRLARDAAARRARAEVLALPAALATVPGCFEAAERLVAAAKAEVGELTTDRDAAETARLRSALGATEGGAVPRGGAAAVKELERAQKSRGTRAQRDALDRALVDLAAYYRDVLSIQVGGGVPLVHADLAEQATHEAAAGSPESTLRRLSAVLACREAVAASVAPQLAVEAMALALRAG